MPSDEKRELVKAIAPTLKSHGFKKKDATWHRLQNGFIQTINVQGSQWGKSFYLNLGIYITALGNEIAPPEYHCHIRNRVGNVVENLARYNELLDFENSIPNELRYRELLVIIETKAIPWLVEFSEHKRIVAWITGEQPLGLPILKSVFEYYGINPIVK